MLLRFRTVLVALCSLVASLGLAPGLHAQDLLVIDRGALADLLAKRPNLDTLPPGSGQLVLGENGELTVEQIMFSKIPDICMYIYYGPDSPWVQICGGGISPRRDKASPMPSAHPLIEAAKHNQANLEQLCKLTDCSALLPNCPEGEWFNPVLKRCIDPREAVLCHGVPLASCINIPKIEMIPAIFGGGCTDTVCLPDDFLKRDLLWPPGIPPELEDQIFATQGTVVNVGEIDLLAATKALAADQFLILSR